MNTPTILCVDDERSVLFVLRTQLLRYFPNYIVALAEGAVEALKLVDRLLSKGRAVPLVIADQKMPGMKGDELLIELHRRYPQIIKVMLTGQANAVDIGNIVNQGNLYRFIPKPWDEADLILTVTEALKRYQQDQQLIQQQAALAEANRQLAASNADMERQVQSRTQQLQHNEQLLRFFVAHVPAAVAMFDCNMRYLLVSQRWKVDYGLDDQGLIGQSHYDIFPDIPDRWRQAHQRCLSGVSERVEEDCFVREDGSVIWVQWETHPWYTETSEIGGIILFSQVISDRKRAEAALRASEERLRIAFDAAHMGSWDWNLLTNRIIWSDSLERLMGFLPGTFDKRFQTFTEMIYPADRQRVLDAINRSIEQGDEYDIEFRFVTLNGDIRWAASQGNVLRDQTGSPVRMVGVDVDITKRKRSELALRESEERWALAIEGSNDGIWDRNLKTGESFLSSRCLEIVGHPYEAVNSLEKWLNYVHPEDCQMLQTALQSYLDRKTPTYTCEYRMRCRGGDYKWLLVRGKAIWDETGAPTRIIGSVTDITLRRQAEITLQQLNEELEQRVQDRTQELLRSEQDLRTIFNNVYDAILIHAMDGTILDANDRALELRGATRAQLIGATVADLSAPDAPLERIPEFLRRVQAGETLRFEWREQRFDDHSLFDVEVSLRPVTLGNRSVFIGGTRDISHRKRAEVQLQQANDELLRATRLKDEFLANMSHELRTPLNSILGMTEGLQDEIFGPITERQLNALKTIERSGFHLLSLINDILDVAKIESGQIALEYTTVAVKYLCESSLAFVKQQALKKRIQLDLQLSPDLPDLYVDERRIRQVLINLLTNAVKFTPEAGCVTLAATCSGAPERQGLGITGYLYLSVTDTGIGMSPDSISKLFQPFIQIDSALNRQHEGTGLGLVLVKRLVELHGGEVSLTSEEGGGSCFTITLPLINIHPANLELFLSANASPHDAMTENSPLILLVEDNEINRNLVSDYLEINGYRLLLASNGQEALALAQAERPDLILMDIQMPEMDGIEAMQCIRRDPNLVAVPIIALTALAMTGDRERCLAAGANDYLSKPYKLKHLATVIQRLLTS